MDKRWIGYIRVSSDEQAKGGTSLEQQRRAINGWAQAGERELAAIVEDAGHSAKSLARPGMGGILDQIGAGEVAGIMVYRLDRLTRSVRDIIYLMELLERHQVALISVSESIDTTTPMGRMIIHMSVAVAQWQREDIVERVTAGMRARMAQGAHTGGSPPRGLTLRERDGAKYLTVCPRTGSIVAELWPRALRGESLSELATWARAQLPQHQWYKQSVDRLLRNPRYIGLLVDAETHAAVRARMGASFGGASDEAHKRKALLGTNPSGRAWPLKGIGRCAECGSHLHGVRSKGKMGKYYYYYRCLGRARNNGCKAKDLHAKIYERAIAEALIEHLAPDAPAWDELRAAAAASQQRSDHLSDERQAIVMQRDKAAADQDRLLDLYLGEGAGRDAIRGRLDKLAETINGLDAQLAVLDAKTSMAAMDTMQVDSLVTAAQQGLSGLADAPPEQQAAIYQRLVSEAHMARSQDHIDLVLWPLGTPRKSGVYNSVSKSTGRVTVVNSVFGGFSGVLVRFGFVGPAMRR